jgi:hypothetical protein
MGYKSLATRAEHLSPNWWLAKVVYALILENKPTFIPCTDPPTLLLDPAGFVRIGIGQDALVREVVLQRLHYYFIGHNPAHANIVSVISCLSTMTRNLHANQPVNALRNVGAKALEYNLPMSRFDSFPNTQEQADILRDIIGHSAV